MRKAIWLAAFLALGAGATCADLDSIDPGQCGNGIVEPGEDCDMVSHKSEQGTGEAQEYPCYQPGEEHACRFRCSRNENDGERQSCPDGWGCGIDDVCRASSGVFEQRPAYQQLARAQLDVADFDGDTLPDLLAHTAGMVHVLYGEPWGDLVPGDSYPMDFRPGIGRLTDSPRDDLILLFNEALSVMRGQQDRSFRPTIYAPFPSSDPDVWALLMEAMPESRTTELLEEQQVVVYHNSGDELLVFEDEQLLHRTLEDFQYRLPLEGIPDAMDTTPAGPPQIGDLFDMPDGVGHGCDEVVVGRADASEVFVYSPCYWPSDQPMAAWIPSDFEQRGLTPTVSVTVPPPAAVSGRVLLAHLNDDAFLDLVIGVSGEFFDETKTDCGGAGGSGVGAAGAGGSSAAGGAGGAGFVDLAPEDWPVMAVAYSSGDGYFVGTPDELTAPPPPDQRNRAALVYNSYLSELSPTGDDPESPSVGVLRAPPPLAAGDLNDDGVVDFVTSTGVLLSQMAQPSDRIDCIEYRKVASPSNVGSWDYGYIDQFNGDLIPDIVVASSSEEALTFLNGAGQGLFNPFTIPLDGLPGLFAVGDFDGDRLTDVAFAERDSQGDESLPDESPPVDPGAEELFGDTSFDGTIAVSFGTAFGPPTEPVRMGRVRGLDSMVAGRVSSQSPDGVDDLLIVTRSTDEQTSQRGSNVALLQGSGERLLLSPFLFRRQGEFVFPVSAVVGQFDDEPGHQDLAVLTVGVGETSVPEFAVWRLPSRGEAQLSRQTVSVTKVPDEMERTGHDDKVQGRIATELLMLSAVDLGDDGRDEIVALTMVEPEYAEGTDSALVEGVVMVWKVVDGCPFDPRPDETSGSDKPCWVLDDLQTTTEAFGTIGGLSFGDEILCDHPYSPMHRDSGSTSLDDLAGQPSFIRYDGRVLIEEVTDDPANATRPDVVALGVTVTLQDEMVVCTTGIAVLPNEGGEDVGLGASQLLINALHPDPELAGEGIRIIPEDFVFANVDGDGEREIVLLNWDGVYAADIDWQNHALVNARLLFAHDIIEPGGRLAAGDFNGDGVDDLAVSTSTSTTIFWGAAVNP